MPFQKGNTLGKGRPKGSKNGNAKVKEQLADLLSEALDNIDIQSMSTSQLLKFIQLGLNYELPKLGHEINELPEIAEQPLFVSVLERDDNDKVVVKNMYEYTGEKVPKDSIPDKDYDYLDSIN